MACNINIYLKYSIHTLYQQGFRLVSTKTLRRTVGMMSHGRRMSTRYSRARPVGQAKERRCRGAKGGEFEANNISPARLLLTSSE
jgi:hypothetical protein